LAEAESVLTLVRASERDTPHLFLLDEIFRGTNTTGRVAAGAAVLAYLNRGPHLTLVATHDLELLDLLGEQYATHHFREHVATGALRFDYRLYAGPSSTRNAIALLDVLQYPAALVADALAAADWHRRRAGVTNGVTAGGDG
jgi:DNA mismatch repair ATPase MutS